MTQYNTFNLKLSNSQLNKLKSVVKHGTKATFNLSLIVVGDSNDEISFRHKLLAKNSLANINLSKTQQKLLFVLVLIFIIQNIDHNKNIYYHFTTPIDTKNII